MCDIHAPIKKYTVRSSKATWLDTAPRALMKERDQLKKTASKSGDINDWNAYRVMRNKV